MIHSFHCCCRSSLETEYVSSRTVTAWQLHCRIYYSDFSQRRVRSKTRKYQEETHSMWLTFKTSKWILLSAQHIHLFRHCFFIINWSGQTFICSLSKKASREEHCKIIYSILLPQSLLYFHPSFYDLKANLLQFLSFPVISCSKGGCSYEIALNMFLIMSSVYVQVIPKSQNLRLF